jgi:methylmalonyl-CoA/ethylmalonyl-CoA epimerase
LNRLACLGAVNRQLRFARSSIYAQATMKSAPGNDNVDTQDTPALPLSRNIIGIDHIAVAVPDLQAAVAWATGQLGCKVIEERTTTGKHSGMKSAAVRLGALTLVFVEGTGSDSQVTQFVERHGAGVQHIALRVKDMGQAISALHTMPFSTPRLDCEPLSQIFSVRDPATGLMLELIERRNYDGFSDQNVQALFDSLEEKDLY